MEYKMYITPDIPKDIWEQTNALCLECFGFEYDNEVYTGSELAVTQYYLFCCEENGEVLGSCLIARSITAPDIGTLGHVMVSNKMRGNNIAGTLLQKACEFFEQLGGKALFLATENPVAAKVYANADFYFISGTRIMIHYNGTQRDFYKYWFNETNYEIVEGGAVARVQVVPFSAYQTERFLLDANVNLFSTFYVTQGWCDGIYGKFDHLQKTLGGKWIWAKGNRGQVLGIATYLDNKVCVYAIDKYEGLEETLLKEILKFSENKDAKMLIHEKDIAYLGKYVTNKVDNTTTDMYGVKIDVGMYKIKDEFFL